MKHHRRKRIAIQRFYSDDNVPVPAEAAAFTLLKEQLVEVLEPYRKEQRVLRLRFGLMMEGKDT